MSLVNVDSPRAQESMRRLGILASEIRPRSLASFAEEHVPADFQVQRKQFYDRKRCKLFQEIAAERSRVCADQKREENRKRADSSALHKDQKQLAAQDFVALEQNRLRKMEQAQRKELQQFIEYEIKLQEIRRVNEAKRAKDIELEERRQREKRQRAKEWEKQRKAKEEQKYLDEVLELQRQEAVAERQFKEAQKIKRKELEDQARRKEAAIQKELERRRNQEKREEQLHQMQVEHEQLAYERQHLLEEREAKRTEEIAKRREHEIEAHRAQAEALRLRVQNVKKREQTLLEQKKEAQERRTAKAERRRAKFEAERNQHIQKLVEESHDHMKKVQAKLQANNEKYDRRKRAFAEKEALEQAHQEEMQRQRKREHDRAREQEHLQKQERFERIHRQQRARAYRCQKTREQIEQQNQLWDAIKARSRKIIEQRRCLAIKGRMQKEALTKKLEHIKLAGLFSAETIAREFDITIPDRPTPSPKAEAGGRRRLAPTSSLTPGIESDEKNAGSTTMLRSASCPRMATLVVSRPTPTVGPLSRQAYSRLVRCGHVYDIDMSWLQRPPHMPLLRRADLSALG